MSKNKRKRHKHKPIHSPLAFHRKSGTKLITFLSDIGVRQIQWERDVLPEFLWIAALAIKFGIDAFHTPYGNFMDAVDDMWSINTVPLGLISDFALFPTDRRSEFLAKNTQLIEEYFRNPIGRIISFYPECPAAWLLQKEFIPPDDHLDPEIELGHLRSLVIKLLAGKDAYASRVRIVPLDRLFKHDKIRIFDTLKEILEAIPKYPSACSEDFKSRVESFARTVINMEIEQRVDLQAHEWPKYFWRHNYDLAVCKHREASLLGGRSVDKEAARCIQETMAQNAISVREYLADLRQKLKLDLYDPTRDEVLFGLFSRVTRLYSLFADDPHLWARDIAGIILRCLAETAITFTYLMHKGHQEDFRKFIEYGDGQQKLLMLHLQDNYPNDKSLEDHTVKDMSDQMGSFYPELLDIQLGHWMKKDTRDLAREAGMEKVYRLVFTPTSSDLHGSWLNLKYSNFTHCIEPLHRFHRLPAFAEPPFFIKTAEIAREIYESCLEGAIKELEYPAQRLALRKIDIGNKPDCDTPKAVHP